MTIADRPGFAIVDDPTVSGEFVSRGDDTWYVVRNVDRMPPFFISVVSSGNQWLFVSSNGGVTAGRVSPDNALFPYVTVDKIYDSPAHTGPRTLVRLPARGKPVAWEPFSEQPAADMLISRNLYKNTLGNKLCFEEVNHTLQLAFRYTWVACGRLGIARQCELENLSGRASKLELIDGLQNLLPAGTPRITQANTSNLVDAYKWNEIDPSSGLGMFALYSGISDRAEPSESLRANTVFCVGLANATITVSAGQVQKFRDGGAFEENLHSRGVRGAYFAQAAVTLSPGQTKHWQLVADVNQGQADVVKLRKRLARPDKLYDDVQAAVNRGTARLARILAEADAVQCTGETQVAAHHVANVLFNTSRGGIFCLDGEITRNDFARVLRRCNAGVYERNAGLLADDSQPFRADRFDAVLDSELDPQFRRLLFEYLPVSFSRRHGDPSRPWNQFYVQPEDEQGKPLLAYQGNWRDIFQNWEALAFSFPEFIENVIAKFLNASTMDGYNPYRVTSDGFDWEVQHDDDPWSYIGYWGDHQVIYLLKLLELSDAFHPGRLAALLDESVFCYANVPYRIRPLEDSLRDPKNTIDYDFELAAEIEQRVRRIGSDGKLVLDENDNVYQVSLLEKLLIPLLAKLGNLVIDGGIWMNTQRPEWNDANNALVGHGLSMVTLCYLRRYLAFLLDLLEDRTGKQAVTSEVAAWLRDTATALRQVQPWLGQEAISAEQRHAALTALGSAACRYRDSVYSSAGSHSQAPVAIGDVVQMLRDALAVADHTIATNQRQDHLYEAYNLLDVQEDRIDVHPLYPMLEGQVAALSSGALPSARVIEVVEALFESDIYRPDLDTFMLYPDRPLPGFLERNRIAAAKIEKDSRLQDLVEQGAGQLLLLDDDGWYRFHPDIRNMRDLRERLDEADSKAVEAATEPLCELYEQTFRHRAFTGRSGTMFGFEGLGCVYWHMVAKLLLAIQEQFFAAHDGGETEAVRARLGELYYRVRNGLGFNKSPADYGAFPTDPYSHTPGHAGAQQPGMTGQVKEEILSRFGELGIRVNDGQVRICPYLLRAREFLQSPAQVEMPGIHGDWQRIELPPGTLAFTWCQVPWVYRLDDAAAPSIELLFDDDTTETLPDLLIPAETSSEIFRRTGRVQRVTITLGSSLLHAGDLAADAGV